MLLHSGFQFWNKSEDHRESMSIWFTLRYAKICPSKCQTPSPCSFATHAVRSSHYALHFTEQWKPHRAEDLLNGFQSHTRLATELPKHERLLRDLNPHDILEPDWCAYCRSVTNGFTSPSRGWTLQKNPFTLLRITASPISAKVQQGRITQQEHSKRHTHIPNFPEHLTESVHFSERKFILLFFLGARTKALATRRIYTVGQELTPPSWCPRSQLWYCTDQDQNPLALSPRKD